MLKALLSNEVSAKIRRLIHRRGNRPLLKWNRQEQLIAKLPNSHAKDALLAPWIPLGPAPIPNGQTVGISTPVSGRTISIAVHPTNPNIVYVGAAQGGLYRSTDGGRTGHR